MAEKRIEIFESPEESEWAASSTLADDACQALATWLKVRRWKTELIFCGQAGRPLSYEVSAPVRLTSGKSRT